MRFCPALAAVIVLAISATPADLLAQQRPPIDGRLLPLATDTFVVLYGDMVIGQSIMQRFAEEERLVQVYTWRASTGEVIVDSLWTDHRTLRPIREARVAGANVEEVMFGPDTLIVVRRNAGRMSRSVLPNQPSAYSSASLDALAAALDLRDGLAQDVLLYYAPPASLGYVTTRVEVQRSERVRTTDGQESDAWVLAATTPGGGSTFWIDKATRALLMFDTQEGDATIHFRRQIGLTYAVKLTRRQFEHEEAGENSYSSSRAKELDKRAAYLQALDRLSADSMDHSSTPRPLPAAYSRVTNPGRFRHLQDVAQQVLAELEAEFVVTRREGPGLNPGIEQRNLSRPSVELVPADPNAASIIVAFTDFPGIVVRCGRRVVEAFPACGCDACEEDPNAEEARFRRLIRGVTLGWLKEFSSVAPSGQQTYRHELRHPARGGGSSAAAWFHYGEGNSPAVRTTVWKRWPRRQLDAAV